MAARLLPEDPMPISITGMHCVGSAGWSRRASATRAQSSCGLSSDTRTFIWECDQKELGRLEAAVRSYSRGLNFVPRSAAAHSNLGGALHELGRLHQAVESYSKALDIDPLLAETHGNLCAALLVLGQAEKAATSLERALTLDPISRSLI